MSRDCFNILKNAAGHSFDNDELKEIFNELKQERDKVNPNDQPSITHERLTALSEDIRFRKETEAARAYAC